MELTLKTVDLQIYLKNRWPNIDLTYIFLLYKINFHMQLQLKNIITRCYKQLRAPGLNRRIN